METLKSVPPRIAVLSGDSLKALASRDEKTDMLETR